VVLLLQIELLFAPMGLGMVPWLSYDCPHGVTIIFIAGLHQILHLDFVLPCVIISLLS
jgi:hypothetical protein